MTVGKEDGTLELLKVDGVMEHLPIAVAIFLLGVAVIGGVLVAWNKLVALMERAVNTGIELHEANKHNKEAQDSKWEAVEKEIAGLRGEFKSTLDEIRQTLKDLSHRLDRHVDRHRNPDDSRP